MTTQSLTWTRNNNGQFVATTTDYRYRTARLVHLADWGYDIQSLEDGRIVQSGLVCSKDSAMYMAEQHVRMAG